jgi:alanine dehydrogenase
MYTLVLSRNDIQGLLDMTSVLEAVEQAFRDWAEGKAVMPTKSYLLLDQGDFRSMPAALPGSAGVKWVNVHPHNVTQGLPTIMAILVYSDPLTGYPLAIMDATDITAYRTGAAAAIASKYLARKDSHTLGIIGAGYQSYTQILAHAALFDFRLIKVFDLSTSSVKKLIQHFPQYPLQECSLEETAASDIVCTLTPSLEPILKFKWVSPGTHINAIGADAEGKEELDPAILKDAIIVVDDMRQAASSGEINVPIRKGLLKTDDIYANLGEIITGKKQGRIDGKSITVFDSTGLAIEDIAVAKIVYGKAKLSGNYLSLDLIEGGE